MKYTNNKKGFTLVELLVVIAILAILATVSIVGYSSFTKNAKMSNDEEIVEQWNELLRGKDALEDAPINVIKAKEFFIEENYNGNFIPQSSGYHFYWSEEDNRTYLVDDSKNNLDIIYPNDELEALTSNMVYRLDKDYCLLTENHDDYDFDKKVLVVNEDNEISISTKQGKQKPTKVIIGASSYIVNNNNITIKPTSNIKLTVTEFILKQDATVTDATSKDLLFYTGEDQVLINEGSKNGGEWHYKVNDGTYSTDLPMAKNAGTYTVYYKFVGGDEFFDISEKSVSVTINKKKITVPSAISNLIYNGSSQTGVSFSGTEYLVTNYSQTNAGNYTATASLNDKNNFEWDLQNPTTDNQTINWSISKANATTTSPVAKTDLKYILNQEQALLTAGTTNGGKWQYSLNNSNYTDNVPKKTDCDEYIVFYKLVGGDNYYDISVSSVKVSISKADNTINGLSCSDIDKKFAPKPSYTSTTSGTPTYTYSTSENGTYSNWNQDIASAGSTLWVKASISESTNYKAAESKTSFKVSTNYLMFKATANNSSITPHFKSGSYQYSKNGGTWTTGSNSGTTISLNKNDYVLLKGKDCMTDGSYNGFDISSKTCFTMTGNNGSIIACGSVTSLTDEKGIDQNISLDVGCYKYMFCECQCLSDAPELPSLNLAKDCYRGMFLKCNYLKTVPELPATTMKDNCYMYMFKECTSITKTPTLDSTNLAYSCYSSMFRECTSLVTVPTVLPATTAKEFCYQYMFDRCTSLTYAPEIKLSNVAMSFTTCMFYGCTSLKVKAGSGNGKILSIPSGLSSDDIGSYYDSVFQNTGGTFTDRYPVAGNTYYWYK